jgi:HK97 family phage major capsid protein
VTSQLSITETQGTANNASSIYCFDPNQVVGVFREDASIEVDNSRLFNSDQSEIRAIMRADVVVPNPKAVCRILGIIP